MRLQTFLFPQADDAPGYPDVQTNRQIVLLQEGGTGRFPHGCPYLLTGRNRRGSQPLHRRTEVNNLFIHIKNKRRMEQNRNMEQGGTAAAVPTEKKNENRKREVSGKDAQIIRAFLESVGIYEADALRVSIAIADGKVSADNTSADDRLALNRYLNSSTDNDRLTADNVQGHRLNRAFGLLERVSEFCDKQQLVTVNRALLSIAVNAEDINRAVSSLDKRPASVQPT